MGIYGGGGGGQRGISLGFQKRLVLGVFSGFWVPFNGFFDPPKNPSEKIHSDTHVLQFLRLCMIFFRV